MFQTEKPPDLGKVWSAQERLWIQRTLLEVVAQVNKNAKNWDTAIIKQIDELEVGNPIAQDQRSLAKNEDSRGGSDDLCPRRGTGRGREARWRRGWRRDGRRDAQADGRGMGMGMMGGGGGRAGQGWEASST